MANITPIQITTSARGNRLNKELMESRESFIVSIPSIQKRLRPGTGSGTGNRSAFALPKYPFQVAFDPAIGQPNP